MGLLRVAKIANPLRLAQIIDALHDSYGDTVAVAEEDILTAGAGLKTASAIHELVTSQLH